MRKLQTQGVHHITIVGADRQTSIDFWEGVLGMPFVFEQPNLDRASESHLYFDPGDGRLITVFTDEGRKPDPRRTPTEPGCVHHLAMAVSAATFRQAVERLDERGIEHSGVKDRGFMDSIYFKDPLGLLIELAAYRFEPPWGWTHGAGADGGAQDPRRARRLCDRGGASRGRDRAAERARTATACRTTGRPKDPYRAEVTPDRQFREDMMKLYMHPASITSRIVRLYIAEKGLKVDEEVVDLFTGAHHQAPFVGINPNRLVPVLEDGDLRMTESAAILIYLAEKNDLPEIPTDARRAGEGQRGDGLGELQLLPRLGLQPRLSAALSAPQAPDRGGAQGRCRVGPRQGDFLAAGAERPLAGRRADLADRRGDHRGRLLSSAGWWRSAT